MNEKKELKPELREIYERVMNVPTSNSSTPQENSPTTPQVKPVAPQSKPEVVNPTVITKTPSSSIIPGKEFVFNGKGHHDEPVSDHHPVSSSPNSHTGSVFLNGKVMILGVIFVLVWTMFWLVLLGVLKPASFGL